MRSIMRPPRLFALLLIWGVLPVAAIEGVEMAELMIQLDGSTLGGRSALVQDGEVLVPLDAFCEALGAEAKVMDGSGVFAVCREDLCIPLNTEGGDTADVDGVTYGRLEAFGGPLGLDWTADNGTLRVSTGKAEAVGLGIGSRPPDFTLPDLYTGEAFGPANVVGKRAVFYMWASW